MRLFSNINLGQIVANKTIQVEVGAAESDSTFNALTALDVSGLSIPAQACFVGVIVSFTCCERISIFFHAILGSTSAPNICITRIHVEEASLFVYLLG